MCSKKRGNANPKATPICPSYLLCAHACYMICTAFNLCKLFDLQRVSIFFPAKGRPRDQSRKAKERKWCQLINLKPILALWIYN